MDEMAEQKRRIKQEGKNGETCEQEISENISMSRPEIFCRIFCIMEIFRVSQIPGNLEEESSLSNSRKEIRAHLMKIDFIIGRD